MATETTRDPSDKAMSIDPLLEGIDGDAYLGDRETIEALLQLLLGDAVDDLKTPDPAAATQPRVEKAAAVLLGKDPNHQPVRGWNTEHGGIADWFRATMQVNEESDQEVLEVVLWHWIKQVYDLIANAEDDGSESQHAVESLIDQAANLLMGLPASMGSDPDMLDGTPDSHPSPPEAPPAEEPEPLEQPDEGLPTAETSAPVYNRWRNYP